MNEERFKQRCEKLLVKLRKDFPVVNNVNLKLKIKKLRSGSLRIDRFPFSKYVIIIDYERYEDASDDEIIGGLAHELCHLEDSEKTNFLTYLIQLAHYLLSRKFMVKDEIENDIRTIKKGYGKQMIANRKYRIKKYPANKLVPKNKRPFLLPEEIKSLMKKLKGK